MTMFHTLRLDLVILLTSCKAHLELEGWPADQIPQSVGWVQAAWLLCFGAVPRQQTWARAVAPAAESHHQQQQQEASSSLM